MQASKILCFIIISGTFLVISGWSYQTMHRQRAKAQDFLYVVRLQIDKAGEEMICTGALIHPQWVLTAAHCTAGYTSIEVYAAKAEAENGTETLYKERSAEKSIIYPGFVNKLAIIGVNLNNDYSLIRLKNSFDVDNVNVGLALLENKTWTDNKARNCIAVGFGSMHDEEGLYVFSLNTRQGTCPCKTKNYLLDSYICSTADGKYESSICPGDSGGPLICNNKQVGIASYIYPSHACDLFSTRSSKDFGCDVPGTVSVFTYICPVLSWIRKYVGENIPIQPIHC